MDYEMDPTVYDVPDPTSAAGGYTGMLPVGGDSGGSGLLDFLKSISPTALNTLLGALGPTAGLVGSLASGGAGPTTTGATSGTTSGSSNQTGANSSSGFTTGSGTSNQTGSSTSDQTTSGNTSLSGTTTGNTTTNQTGTTTGTSKTDTSSMPVLNPLAEKSAGALSSMLGGLGGSVGDAYNMALKGLMGMGSGGGASMATKPGGPNTTPTPAPVTGFPDKLPTDLNPDLVNLIKQAFGTMTGDIASSAITGARNRGFAGGAGLLNTAAAPIASGALAAVPAKEAEAYLAHVLQAYDLQSQNAGRKASAEQGSLNAATNALMPGVQAYGTEGSMYNAELAAEGNKNNYNLSLMNALMGPMKDWTGANLGLIGALPHGTTGTSLTGTSGTSTLSGTGTSDTFHNEAGSSLGHTIGSGTNTSAGTTGSSSLSGSSGTSSGSSNTMGATSGNTTGTATTPLGTTIGTGIGNIAGGVGVGLGTPSSLMSTLTPAQKASILKLLGG